MRTWSFQAALTIGTVFGAVETHQGCLQRDQVPRTMLRVDEKKIKTNTRHKFSHYRIGQAEPPTDHGFTGLQPLLERKRAGKSAPDTVSVPQIL